MHIDQHQDADLGRVVFHHAVRRRQSLAGVPEMFRTHQIYGTTVMAVADIDTGAIFPSRTTPITFHTAIEITANAGVHKGIVFEFSGSDIGAALWIGDNTIGFHAGEDGMSNGATALFDNTIELPVGLLMDLVVAIRPGDGRVRMWGNGKELARATASSGTFGASKAWAEDANGSFAAAAQGTVIADVPAASQIAPNGFTVIEPLSIYLGQVPRHFVTVAVVDDDPSLTFEQNFLLNSGHAMASAAVRGPVLTFTRASSGTYFDENALLVTASTNAPRFDHDPVTGAARGFLPEEQRENVIIQSNNFTAVGWTAINGAASAVTLLNPAGNTGSYKFQADGVGESYLQQTAAKTVTSGANQSLSWIVKRGNNDFVILIGWDNATKGIRQWFNLSNGSVGTATAFGSGFTVVSAVVENLGNDWYRLKVTYGITGTTFQVSLAIATADAVIGTPANGQYVNLYSSGIEEGSSVTSSIFTTTAAVIRSADVDSATITSLLGSANTLVISARTGYGAGVVVQIDDGTENERYRVERNASNELRLFVTDGGVEQVGASGLNLGTVADLTDFTLAIRLAANDFASSLDGAAVVTDGSGTLPTVTTIRAGMDTSGDEWNSTIAEIKLHNVGKLDSLLRSIAA